MWAKENKAKVIAVTSSPIAALGQIGDIVLLADSTGIGTQNSLVAPMAVANAGSPRLRARVRSSATAATTA